MKVTVRNGQSVLDVIIQYYGSLDNTAEFLNLNPEISLTSKLSNGQILIVEPEGLGDENVKGFYTRNNVVTNNDVEAESTGDFNSDFNNDFAI